MKRRIVLSLISAFLFMSFLFGIPASASSYKSFSRNLLSDGTYENTYSRDTYTATKIIRASDFSLADSFGGISDIFVADNGLVYILCSDESEVVVLNEDLSIKEVLTLKSNDEKIDFKEAKGLYVSTDSLYICDTENSQILVADLTGNIQNVLPAPKADTIPKDFVYQPISMGIDKDGYTYVLSMGCYYGAIVYTPDGEFSGFYGANSVQATALDTLDYIWDLITGNDEKKAASQKVLPYAFTDFCFDKQGYMVTCTGATTGGYSVGQINKLSPNGANILFKNNPDGDFSNSTGVNFLEDKVIKRNNSYRAQDIVSLSVDDKNYIYALDATYGIIYLYDEQCNLVSAFGGGVGSGERLGNFQKPVALALAGNKLLVADSGNESITVFEETQFGALIKKAQSMHIDGDYDEAKPVWEQVLGLDRNNQLAYKGLAMSAYNEGELELSLDYAQKGLDYATYDLAFQQVFKNFIADNFIWIFFGVIVLFVGVILGFRYKKAHKIIFIKNIKLRMMLTAPIHPYNCFNELKEKKTGSVKLAVVMIALFYLTTTIRELCQGFLFSNISRTNYNTLMTLAQTVGLVLLWVIVNWLICSLFSGKGTLKEVFISSAYCLLPMVLYNIVRTVFSPLMPLSGKALLDGIQIAIVLYTLYLFSVALITIHEYSFTKVLGTTVVTFLGMLLVLFIIFMIFILLQQFSEFITSIFVEVFYR